MSLKKKLRFQQKRFLWLPNDHTNHSTDPQPTSLQSQCLKIYQKSLIFSILAPRFKIQILEKLAMKKEKIHFFRKKFKWDIFENFILCAQLETRKKYWKLMYKIIFLSEFYTFRSHRPRSIFFIQYLCTVDHYYTVDKTLEKMTHFLRILVLCVRGPWDHHHIVNIRIDKGFSYYDCQSCKYTRDFVRA